jgi:hypothetical protein
MDTHPMTLSIQTTGGAMICQLEFVAGAPFLYAAIK